MKHPKFLLRGFRRPSEVALLALGKLERQVLDEAWRRGEVSVRDIYLAFEERIAYTTLMTTLDRLFRKQILDRRKDGRAFLYSPAVSCEEFEHGIRADVINELILKLQRELKVTSIVVTHDMQSAFKVGDRIVMLHEGHLIFDGTPEQIQKTDNPVVKRFVQGEASEQELAQLNQTHVR